MHHNCCNRCSPSYYVDDTAPQARDDIGQARTHSRGCGGAPAAASPSAAATAEFPITLYADVVTPAMFRIRVEFLRSLEYSFWDEFHEHVCWYGQTDCVKILMSSLIAHWPEAETSGGALKVMSKFGAVKAHRYVPMSKAYDKSGQAYFDPGNETYAFVLMHLWDNKALTSRHITRQDTTGDVVEALLGFGWFLYHPENVCSTRNMTEQALCYRLIQALHEVIAYTYDHWDRRCVLPWRYFSKAPSTCLRKSPISKWPIVRFPISKLEYQNC